MSRYMKLIPGHFFDMCDAFCSNGMDRSMSQEWEVFFMHMGDVFHVHTS